MVNDMITMKADDENKKIKSWNNVNNQEHSIYEGVRLIGFCSHNLNTRGTIGLTP